MFSMRCICFIIEWTYKNYFSCDSKDVIYFLICKTCDNFYLGQTQDFKQRTAKHKSDVKNPHTSSCRICSEHLRDCNQAEPYFQIFPFYYETSTALREKNDTFSDGNLHQIQIKL